MVREDGAAGAPGGGGDDHLIVLQGDVDWSSAPVVEAQLGDGLAATDGRLVVDCAQVTFIDSMGLRLLISARNEATARGRDLVVRDPSAVMRRILEITALDRILLDEPA